MGLHGGDLKNKSRGLWLAAVLFVLAVPAAGYVLRDTLATAYFQQRLDASPAVSCEPLQVTMSADLGHATLAPMTCRITEGPIAELELREPATLAVGLKGIEAATAPSVRLDSRPRSTEHVELDVTGELLAVVNGHQGIIKGVLDARDRYSAETPRVDIGELIQQRGGETEVTLHQVEIYVHDDWAVTRAERGILAKTDVAELHALDLWVKPDAARVDYGVRVTGPLGNIYSGDEVTFRLVGEGLDTQEPRFNFDVELGDS
jgi:hypothetical protein